MSGGEESTSLTHSSSPGGKLQSPPNFNNFSLRRVTESLRVESRNWQKVRAAFGLSLLPATSRKTPSHPTKTKSPLVPSGSPQNQDEEQALLHQLHQGSQKPPPSSNPELLGPFTLNVNYPRKKVTQVKKIKKKKKVNSN